MASIRHFPATHPLPDWRNFGVMLRVLLGVNLLALAVAFVQSPGWADWMYEVEVIERADAPLRPILAAVP